MITPISFVTLSGLPGQANQSNFFSFQTIYSKKTKKPRIKEARGKPGSFHQDNSTTNGPLIQLSCHLGNYNSHNASVALFSLLTENKVRGREAHKGRLYLSHKIQASPMTHFQLKSFSTFFFTAQFFGCQNVFLNSLGLSKFIRSVSSICKSFVVIPDEMDFYNSCYSYFYQIFFSNDVWSNGRKKNSY